MNTLIKILKAGALLAVIIAAGVFTIKQLMGEGEPPVNPPPPPQEVKISKPVEISGADPQQPQYRPVNHPTVLQNVRRQGKTYVSRVVGNLTGEASKKDWGIRGVATFNYTWGMETTARIEKNDGLTIIEERSFDKVVENVTVSKIAVGLDIPDDVGLFLDALINLWQPVGPIATTLNKRTVTVPDWALSLMRKCNILPSDIDPNLLLNQLKMFTQQQGEYLLQGKKVRITFKDGQGIVRIEPVDGTELTQREIDVIKRSNFVMDHYLMPEREVAVGETWTVPGNVFGGMLDPRLSGKLSGEVKVSRKADFPLENNEVASRLGIEAGHIAFESQMGSKQQIGQLTGVRGSSLIPQSHNVVTEADMTGYAEYHHVSTDHLLFEARMTITPSFRIRYTCDVKD